jgi:serine/threonine protein kinase
LPRQFHLSNVSFVQREGCGKIEALTPAQGKKMQLPVVFNDRYQLIRKIGEGGLAEVFQAQDMS